MSADRQRIDKWLWHARVVRTRGAAAALANGGQVRVNGARIDAAGRAIRPGDVVTVALDRTVRILKVTGFAERRGGASDAARLYEDLTPASSPSAEADVASAPARDPGAGRPTKKDRREFDRRWGGDDD